MDTVNGALRNLESQVESCRQLLAVFQEERSVYNQGRSLTREELAGTLERKSKLIKLFEGQRALLKELQAGDKEFPEELKLRRKELLRSLASLLEQLIVIDQDNERLMREAACTTRRPQPLNPFVSRQRPSLQVQLPLMPFGPAATSMKAPAAAVKPMAAVPKLDESPKAAPAPAPAAAIPARPAIREFKAPAAGILPARPKSHLRVYGSASPAAALSHG